jgi:WhiB family transcriptional regulator, redox-sensing transcriptional regulator
MFDAEPGWFDRAACRGVGWDLFFPEAGTGEHADYSAAQRLCERCTVAPRCLAYAIETRAVEGVWGGLTPKERKTVRRTA